MPYLFASITNNNPDTNSTKGYCFEIGVWQKEHFPLKKIHDNNGILCQNFKGTLQERQ
jgi:hypothetical protein